MKGRDHRQKAEDSAEFLRSWLKYNTNNPNIPEIDKAESQNVIKDLDNVLNIKTN
ncbi:hypothetical protein [Marinomonas sp. CT5]|uniref:hypothetical protein n=1 Tax=Marinomonas sp. CT5 TaxID=2066133 RepID=UPI001BB0AB36|nr:hypothetical protein [Marinomonas sp. CT5]